MDTRGESNTSSNRGPSRAVHVKKRKYWTKKKIIISTIQFGLFLHLYLCIGFVDSILGPIVEILEEHTHSTDKEMRWVLTLFFVGLLVACPISAVIYRVVRKTDGMKTKWYSITINKIMILNLICLIVPIIGVPFVTKTWFLMIAHFFIGLFFELIEIGSNIATGWIWREKASVFLQGLHFCLGVGAILFPGISTQIFKYVKDTDVQIIILYTICGVLISLGILPLFLVPHPRAARSQAGADERSSQDVVKYVELMDMEKMKMGEEGGEEEEERRMEVEDAAYFLPAKTKRKQKMANFLKTGYFYVSAAIIKGCSTGTYVAFGNLIFMYCHEKGFANDSKLAYVPTSFWASFALGRFVNIPAVLYINPFTLAAIHTWGLFFSFVFLLAGRNSFTYVWIGSCLVGYCVAPLSAAAVAIPQAYFGIPLNALSTSVVYIGSTIGNILVSTVVNLVWDVTKEGLFVTCAGLCAFNLLNLGVMYIISNVVLAGRKGEKRMKRGGGRRGKAFYYNKSS